MSINTIATTNNAAWLMAPKARPLEIRPSPMGSPGQDQVLIRSRAIGINPIDGKLQALALYPMEYPAILGQDIAGEIVAVGSGVKNFKPGDRVMAMMAGYGTKNKEELGYQEYALARSNIMAKIPDTWSFERAVVMPLCFSTAASGLFSTDLLNLQRPTHPPREQSTGKTILVWGGSSCVGLNAIQLARAAGYNVLATSSTRNFEIVRRVGASQVFDYNSSTVVADLIKAAEGKTVAGVYDAIGVDAAFQACVEFVRAAGQGSNKFVASVYSFIKDVPAGVEAKKLFGLSIKDNGVAEDLWGDYLPKALAAGAYEVATEPVVVGKGLKKIQEAIDIVNKGMSAQKAVVLLD